METSRFFASKDAHGVNSGLFIVGPPRLIKKSPPLPASHPLSTVPAFFTTKLGDRQAYEHRSPRKSHQLLLGSWDEVGGQVGGEKAGREMGDSDVVSSPPSPPSSSATSPLPTVDSVVTAAPVATALDPNVPVAPAPISAMVSTASEVSPLLNPLAPFSAASSPPYNPLPSKPLKKRAHKRTALGSISKQSRAPSAPLVTGSTPFTKPAQGALRMNKFVQRLHTALISRTPAMSWQSGCLILHSTEEVTRDVLPLYFKTNNFKTFRRQLNYYGFVHAKSYPNPDGRGTTALWVNQELANGTYNEVDSILLLKRVDASEDAKTADGRRMRKEGAIELLEGGLGKLLGLSGSGSWGGRSRVVSSEDDNWNTHRSGGSGDCSLASSAPQSPALSPSSAPVKETKHLGTSESLSLPEAHAPPRLMRSYTPETEVLARFLMNLGKGDRVASPRGGANWLVM